MAYGLASVRLPNPVRQALRQLLGIDAHDVLPIALECDDVHLLKQVVMFSDTVLACIDSAVREEVEAGLLVTLQLADMPALFNEMGMVSLKGRSFSPVAEFTVNFLTELGSSMISAPALG
jgi:DNA-binding transcriptional LysR family regulator